MKIAIDKKSLDAIKKDNNEYIYLFDDEPLDELLKLNVHCLDYRYCDYVDINLSEYNVECIKKTTQEEKNYDIIENKRDYDFAIIVPNYNNDRGDYRGRTYLKNCIESILDQKYRRFKLIVVDDCSTDTSVETIKSYQEMDDRVILIQNIRKRYNGGSRNVGIEYALTNLKFDYFCFLDSDDWWKDKYVLELINSRLHNHEMMTLGCEMLNANGVFCRTKNEAKNYQELWSLNNALWCTAWARVIRKDKIVYFPDDSLMEDRCWTYLLADNLNYENVINLKQYVYIWNRMNTTNSVSLVRGKMWEASAWKHVGQQYMLLTKMKHKEMIPIIEQRIRVCIEKLNSGIYQQY